MFVVGFSRIALGAHFLTDVLAAMFFGIIWLMLCTVLGKSVGRRTVASLVPAVMAPDHGVKPAVHALARRQ